MKKLSQAVEDDLIIGFQELVRGALVWAPVINQNPEAPILDCRGCSLFPEWICVSLQDVNPEAKIAVGTGLVFDEQLNEFHCLWDDR